MTEAVRAESYGTWSPPASFDGSRSRRILVFGGPNEMDRSARRLLQLLAEISPLVIHGRPYDAAKLDGKLLREWHREERHCSAISLGIIAAVGSGTAAIRQIMIEGCKGGPMPGAVALLGHDRILVETLLAMASRQTNSGIVVEWPPLLAVLSSDDPCIAECARACRAMRSAGIPAALEIVEAGLDTQSEPTAETALRDFAAELDRFFGEHLIADFPKLFG